MILELFRPPYYPLLNIQNNQPVFKVFLNSYTPSFFKAAKSISLANDEGPFF
jgi:hypothetical protein